jgi:NAD(P)-dependent dehydrogenase (short-subunit alcohol dehydrogenase family)
MNNMLLGKKVLITGASSGIGRETAIFCSQQGANIILNGRDQVRLNETLLQLSGGEHSVIAADVSQPEAVKEMMDRVYSEVGMIDALIHCAGIQITLPVQAFQEKAYDAIFNTNVKSAVFLAKALRRKNRYNPEGTSMVLLSSVAASNGEPSNALYAASKAAIEGLSKSLAVEFSRQKIRVNCIAPGLVNTEMASNIRSFMNEGQVTLLKSKHPLGFGNVENIAHAAAFFSSDYSSWITGSVLVVDGGYNVY